MRRRSAWGSHRRSSTRSWKKLSSSSRAAAFTSLTRSAFSGSGEAITTRTGGGETRIQLSVPLLEVERRLAEACEGLGVGYALTQFSGASRTAPSVKPSRATIYLADRAEAVFAALKWRPAERGGNVAVWAPYDESVFWGATEVEGLAVVSPLQLYLDLSAGGEEGQAAAEVILRDKIAPAWGLNHAGSTAE